MKSAFLSASRPILLALCAPFALASLSGCSSEDPTLVPQGPKYPSAEVDLVVDDLGITHVYAKSDMDAFYGAGYAMARDRLFHMELTRRKAFGTSAEILGSKMLKSDMGSRTMNFKKLGEADYQHALGEHKEAALLVEAWVAGINKRIDEIKNGEAPRPYGLGPEELDFVPEPWTPEQSFAIAKVLSFGLSNSFDAELLATALTRLAPDALQKVPVMMSSHDTYTMSEFSGAPAMPKELPKGPFFSGSVSPLPKDAPAFRYEPTFPNFASNNWAVDGAHTDTGKPYLCGDPHQALTSPTRFWPLHMSSVEGGGTLDVIGFAFVGTPSVELGHNAHIGWTATTNFADAMDLWDVPLGGTFENVKVGGQSFKVTSRQEIIKVKPDAGGALEEVPLEIYEVPDFGGIIIPEEILPVPRSLLANGHILFKWTGFEPTTEFEAYLGLDRAKNLDEFEAAADKLDVGAINFVAADATGIDYHVHAQIPDRGDPASHPMPWHLLSSDDPESLWSRGYLPPSKLPSVRNPARGFLATANNDPFGFTSDGSVENDPYYYGTFFAHGFRAKRIIDSLDTLVSAGKVTRQDMEVLQADTHSLMADAMLPHLDDAIKAINTDPDLAAYVGRADLEELAAKLMAWDKHFERTKAEPVIFLGLEWFATKRVMEPLVTTPLFDAIAEKSPPFLIGTLRNVLDERFTGAAQVIPGGNKRALLLAALDDTATWLKDRFGSLDATFVMGDIHSAGFLTDYGGKLTVDPIPVSGSVDTINVSPAPFFKGGKVEENFLSTEMSLYRMVVGFGDDGVPETTLDFARGSREDPNDPHFADQQALWQDAGHTKLPFRKADVEARQTERLKLEAAK